MGIPDQYLTQRVGAEGYRVLALDLDGVCANYTDGLKTAMERAGYEHATGLPDPDSYNLVRATGWPFRSPAEFLEVHTNAVRDGLYRELPIIEGAAEALQELARHDVHIRVLTHRLFTGGSHQRVVADTAAWLDLHRIPYMSLCFTGLKDTVDATVYIDDAPNNIDLLRSRDKNVLIFDQLYNRDVVGPRVTDWQSAVPALLQAFEQGGS